MKTFKCDACGQYYDEVPKIGYKHSSGSVVTRPTSGIILVFDDNNSDSSYDLCASCIRKIASDLNILN